MSIKRILTRIHSPKEEPGFLGPGHTARAVIMGNYSETDPFILLMDDVLDKKDDSPAGGPHPHAGFETVSLLLEGEIGDDLHKMKEGGFQIMTAGSGVVHTETIDKKMKMRLLQLWVNLPKDKRSASPRLQDIPKEHVPSLSADGVDIKLYSGSLAGLSSPIQNYVPMIIADVSMEPGITTQLELPANFNTMLYVIKGNATVGANERLLSENQAGWLDLFGEDKASELKLTAGEGGARFVLYAGKPLGESIVAHGPFIADSNEDIKRLYQEYRMGKMEHIWKVPESQRIFL